MAATFVRQDMLLLAQQLGCIPELSEPARYSIAEMLGSHLYRVYREIAAREHSSILAVVRDVLRKNCEGVA